jgi:DNA polymerase-3 subunit epsilon
MLHESTSVIQNHERSQLVQTTIEPVTEARTQAITWALKVAGEPNTVYLDTETTGLGPDARICDIAVVDQVGNVLLDTLVNPGVPIPAGASAVHGITDAMVFNAPQWGDIADELAGVLAGRTVVIYNRGYDLPLIKRHYELIGIDELPAGAEFQCAMLAYSDFDGSPNQWGNGRKWHKLDAAAERFGIPPGGHRALADADTARQVVKAMAHEGAPAMEPEDLELALEEAFRILALQMALQTETEREIKHLRGVIELHLIADDLTSAESTTTNLVARIDTLTKTKVIDQDQILEWAKSDPIGLLFVTETVDMKSLGEAMRRRGMKVPGAELITEERLVVAPRRGGKG